MNIATWWIGLSTIVTKETVRYLRIWPQTLLPPAITTTLYFLIFGNLIGPRIGTMSGFNYMDFIVPGIIMMSVINNAYANVVSSFFGAKFQRHIEELLVSPLPNWVILLGFVMGGVGRGIAVGLIVTVISLLFSHLEIHHLGITVAVVVLTSVLFSLGGFINAIFAKTFDDISIVPTFILTPLTYLGGVFYSIELLPPFWQKLSVLNPIFHMINAFRYGMIGVTDTHLTLGIGLIVVLTVGLFVACLTLLNRGVGIRS
jgi:ABC-2 type transport system permease protein